MPKQTFDYCALQFLNQWLGKEAVYCKLLASSELENQRKALVKAGGHFRVARNLPKKFETAGNLYRYQPVLDMLNDICDVSSSNVTDVVDQARNRISDQYGGRSVLSLTTKFLWLKIKSPVRIYDKQARIALKTADGDFVAFNDAFSDRYAKCEKQITEACSNLENVLSYSVQSDMKKSEVKNLVTEQWFKERVLDVYLWNQGNA
ncbi:hypothetical protein [Microbulbifer magnicolonia]|uniref:hypothetical protein n=1 Tax=Microbulbifer magnicolonia TaxID=3109744 RepID=UPI002B40E6E6|nr:hypothetical protein [Microbulbifer sp. GG15]